MHLTFRSMTMTVDHSRHCLGLLAFTIKMGLLIGNSYIEKATEKI